MIAEVIPITSYDIAVASLLGVLGFAIGIWFTRVFWMDASTGQATTLWDRIKAAVLFILTGSVPGAVQAFAFHPADGILTISAFCGGFGLGLVVGYFLPQRFLATNVFAMALSLRIRGGGGQPSPLEAFAFATKFGTAEASSLLHLSDTELSRLFQIGIGQFQTVMKSLNALESAIVLDVLCGVPVTQVARDYGQSTTNVITILRKAVP